MHARPASHIAQLVMEADAEVSIRTFTGETGDEPVISDPADAGSIIDVLSLCAVKGTGIIVEIGDEKDTPVMEQIVRYFEDGFGEM